MIGRRWWAPLLVLGVLLCAGKADADKGVVIAVSYFQNNADNPTLNSLSKGLADMLITDLAVSDELTVVERERLNKVLGEIELQQNPFFNARSAARLGKGVGAAYILTGSYLATDKTLRVDVRVVDVETAKVVFTLKETGEPKSLFELEERLATGILNGLGAKLSLLNKKRLGQAAPQSVGALAAYSRALEARDGGDSTAERKALEQALLLDPNFRSVKQRLAALASKVEVLEKSGGRIINPTKTHEFLHNARLQKLAGDHEGVLASLQAAINIDPEMAELWMAVRSIDHKQVLPSKLDARLQPAVVAYLTGNTKPLHEIVLKKGHAYRVQAAIFLFDLIQSELPSDRLYDYRLALDAIEVVEAAEADGRLRRLFVDRDPFSARVRDLRRSHFREEEVRQIRNGAEIYIQDPSELKMMSDYWVLSFVLLEKPRGDVHVTLTRNKAHPHWREKQPSATAHQAVWGLTPTSERMQRQVVERAKRISDSIIYQVRTKTSILPLSFTRFGKPTPFSTSNIRCETTMQLTKQECGGQIELFKGDLVPGLYDVAVEYEDHSGIAVHARQAVWAMEFKAIQSLSPMDGMMAPVAQWHALDESLAADKLREVLEKALIGKNFRPRGLVKISTFFRVPSSDEGAAQVESIHFDIDDGLLGGAALIEKDGPEKWMAYRDLIIKHGFGLTAAPEGIQWIPLPALSVGPHKVCLVSVRRNGSRSTEAECLHFEVQ